MKLINTYYLVFFLMACHFNSKAQQEPMFTKYMFNTLSFNPAYAGSAQALSIRTLARAQWVGLEGAPMTQTVSVSSPLKNQSAAAGLSIINDKIGATGKTFVNLSYAYHIPFNKGKLSIGIQGSILNWRGDWNNLAYRDDQATDYVFDDNSFSKWLPNVGLGFYYYSETFYIGYSAPYLLNNSLVTLDDNDNALRAKQFRHYYASAGIAIPLGSKDLVLKPSVLWKNVGLWEVFFKEGENLLFEGAPNEVDLDLSLLINQKIWIGVSFRTSVERFIDNTSSLDSGDFWIAYYLKNGLKVGMAFDYTLSELQNNNSGSYEIFAGYDFIYDVDKLTTPRYF